MHKILVPISVPADALAPEKKVLPANNGLHLLQKPMENSSSNLYQLFFSTQLFSLDKVTGDEYIHSDPDFYSSYE
jgi:hypothetical protein